MISRVQNYQTKPARVAFKAKENSNIDNNRDSQNLVYKTNAGLKVSAGYIGFQSLTFLIFSAAAKNIKKYGEEVMKDMGNGLDAISDKPLKNCFNVIDTINKNMKYKLPFSILAGVGCGALIDKKINEKHAQVAEKLASEGKKAVLDQEDRAALTKNDNVFYKSNVGKKLGPLLGVAVTTANALMFGKVYKFKLPAQVYIELLFKGLLGGLILGAITDKVSNKEAAKFADKQNFQV